MKAEDVSFQYEDELGGSALEQAAGESPLPETFKTWHIAALPALGDLPLAGGVDWLISSGPFPLWLFCDTSLSIEHVCL